MTVHLNNRNSDPVDLLWLETMPWFITFYLHTLEVKVDGRDERMLFSA